eukprot:gene34087-56798_t
MSLTCAPSEVGAAAPSSDGSDTGDARGAVPPRATHRLSTHVDSPGTENKRDRGGGRSPRPHHGRPHVDTNALTDTARVPVRARSWNQASGPGFSSVPAT